MTVKTKKTKKKKSSQQKPSILNKNSLNVFKNDIYNISKTLNHLYENIKLRIEHFDDSLKETMPSFYKCFLICVKNNMNTMDKILLNEIKSITDFFKKYTKYSLDDNINYIKLTQKQLTRLNNIVEDYCPQLERLFNPRDELYGIPEEHHFLYNIYMSFQGFEQLRNQMIHKLKVYYSYNENRNKLNNHYTIYIKKDNKHQAKFNSELSPLLKQIACRILFYNVWMSTDRIPIFTIYYSNLKKINKTIDDSDKTFRSYNVNTAATDTISKIIIWRKEELLKSVFHECNHFHSIDTILNHNMEKFNKYLFRKLRIDKKSYELIELRESYTEVIANFLNIIARLTISNPRQSSTLLNRNVLKYLNREILFSIEQVAKILKHFNFKRANNFLKIGGDNNTKPILSQTTHVISYYIIKSILLYNISQLLSINYSSKNDDIYEIDEDNKNNKEMRKLHLVLEERGKNEIINIVKQNFVKDSKWLLLVDKNMKKPIKNKTMRMTYYDNS